jgi:cysteine-rich repeat protein
MIGSRPSSSYCDDGNLSNNDGCSDACSIESGF